MKLSTKGRYGARAVLELAVRFGDGPVMVREIAESQDISVRYLEHILNTLRAAGLVKSTRGARGGYELMRDPSLFTIGEVIHALEGPMDIVSCVGGEHCARLAECVMCEIWGEVKSAIDGVLDHITLAEMVVRQNEMRRRFRSGAPDYVI